MLGISCQSQPMTGDEPKAPPTVPDILARTIITASPKLAGSALVFYEGFRDRGAARRRDAAAEIENAEPDLDLLHQRLAASEDLDAAVDRALRAAEVSGLAAKRRLLGRVVAAALKDVAKLDRALIILDALEQIEAPHVRSMVAVRDIVRVLDTAGEMPMRARGAGHEIVRRVVEVGDQQDPQVLQRLLNLDLIFAGGSSERWYVHELTPFGHELLADLELAGLEGQDQDG